MNDCSLESYPSLKLHCEDTSVSRSACRYGEAEASWEGTSICTRGALRGMGPGDLARSTGNNDVKDHLPAGTGDNLQRRCGLGEPKPPRGIWLGAWANRSKEEEVTLLEVVLDATPNRVIPGAGKEALGPGGPSWVHRLWGFDPSMTVTAPRRTSRWVNRDWEGRM